MNQILYKYYVSSLSNNMNEVLFTTIIWTAACPRNFLENGLLTAVDSF